MAMSSVQIKENRSYMYDNRLKKHFTGLEPTQVEWQWKNVQNQCFPHKNSPICKDVSAIFERCAVARAHVKKFKAN